jgi:NitT/TauT family transport system permease protein
VTLEKLRKLMPAATLAGAFLLIWEIGVRLFNVHEYLLPAPSRIAAIFLNEFWSLAMHAGITLQEAGLGFLIANVIAIAIAVVTTFNPWFADAILPFAIALKTTPIVAMAPLLLLWFGNGMAPKIAAAGLISFFPAVVGAMRGFHALEEGEADLFYVYGASNWKILRSLRFRRAAPFIFSALKVSSSLCVVGAIIGEFTGANQGIGYIILVSSYHLETVRMFAALAWAALAGTVFYGLLAMADRRVVFWAKDQSDEGLLESPLSGNSVLRN